MAFLISESEQRRMARTRAPAKLNLFLELLNRRDDGYHEIDTIMVPIDWCDEISVQRTAHEEIRIRVHWLPSQQVIASRLGLTEETTESSQLLQIPEDERNLVHRAHDAISRPISDCGRVRLPNLQTDPSWSRHGGGK